MKVCLLLAPLSLAPQDNKPIRPNLAKGQGLLQGVCERVRVCACSSVCERRELEKLTDRGEKKNALFCRYLRSRLSQLCKVMTHPPGSVSLLVAITFSLSLSFFLPLECADVNVVDLSSVGCAHTYGC